MKTFFIILGIIIASILIFVYVKISQPETYEKVLTQEKKIKELTQTLKKPKTYNFPARVLYLKIDFRNFKKVIIYKLILNVNDKYELFNIKALLNNLNLHYSLTETKKKTEIYILFRSLAQARHTLDLFKEYNFNNIKIKKIIQRI
jgi:peptidyl-tRNA hydrolase